MTPGAPFDALDTLGMWEATAALPEQVTGALGAADDAFARIAPVGGGGFRAVAAFGLGTGGMACTATAALTTPDLTVPFWVGHGSAVPAFVGADTLVLAVSSSGGTAETLTTAEKAELSQLRREVKVLRMEREILKRAATFFAKENA